MSNSNPLQGFFRKAKLQLQLPSNGQWYPKDSLVTNETGQVDVFSMTASDDIKFKSSETNFNGSSTYDLIKSCVPGIKNPEAMPSIDLDTVLLAIRQASYGNDFGLTVDVPGTSLKRKIKLKINELLEENASRDQWDETLIITNSSTGDELTVIVKPNNLASFFAMTKSLVKQNQTVLKLAQNNDVADEDKLDALGVTIRDLGDLKIKLIIDSITSVSIGNQSFNKTSDIENLIRNIDVDYFNAIENHITKQRKKYDFKTITCISTSEELAAGAPKTFEATITFIQSDFFKVDEETQP